MGASLLAKAIFQSPLQCLNYRIREQARSHRLVLRFATTGNIALMPGGKNRSKCVLSDCHPSRESVMRTHLRLLALSALFISAMAQAADLIPIEVHRDANCGCCKKWISHLEANGFKVEDHVENDMSSFKQQHGVPPRLASCHTAIINGKFVEGHVPAEQVLALSKRDDLLGVAAPGMPMGSPGMEMDGMSDAYQIIGLKKDGADVVVADYPAH
ncbi:hypothetical protein D3C87_744470 [compost metagenome]